MKLSLKQIAVLGQVKVKTTSIESPILTWMTLLQLYQQGWWATDRFATIITLVKPKANFAQGFCCVCRRIKTDVNLDTLDAVIQQIADAKYEKYKNILQSKSNYNKIKKTKEDGLCS